MKKIDLLKMYELLYEAYGPQHWWPGETPWEICVGAVLTQNTNWGNVEKALSNLRKSNSICPVKTRNMPLSELESAIRPSGYFRLKAHRLLAVTDWWLENVRNDKLHPARKPLSFWRESILNVKGVGPETADSIMLYSFNLPTFVIDAYTRRIMARHCGFKHDIEYHQLRRFFMDNLPNDPKLFNEFHALFVRMAKEDCHKNSCSDKCPLR
jgi:endonuclease-3 related protein